jgi:5-methylcytosine-specific restriction endonuclease McrA
MFYTSSTKKTGFSHICKKCESERNRIRRLEHHDLYIERDKKRFENNMEGERLRKLDYYHRVKRTEKYRKCKKNADSIRRTYGKTTLSANIIEQLLFIENNTCPACGVPFSQELKFTIDHVKPLSRGGKHSIENIQLLCKSCNCKKHTKEIRYIPEMCYEGEILNKKLNELEEK